MPDQVFVFLISSDAPIQRIVLRVAFAKLHGDFSLCQFIAKIERVCAIGVDVQFRKQIKRIAGDVVALARIDVHALFAHLDAEIVVADFGSASADFCVRLRIGREVVQ